MATTETSFHLFGHPVINLDKARSRHKRKSLGELAYVFVVAPGRSGSTLVQTILNSIPGWKILGENAGSLQGLVQSLNATHKTRYRQKARVPDNGPWFGATEILVDKYAASLGRGFTKHILRPERNTRVTGFKEVRWDWEDLTANLEGVQAIFPNARFILNIRNPQDIAMSAWWSTSKDSIHEVSKIVSAIENTAEEMSKDSFLLRYEEYVSEPSSLKALFDWLGEEWNEPTIRKILVHKLAH